MMHSQKTQYALRAVLELARRHAQGPAKIGEIAAAQSIPARFLEVILNELKQGGFVESRRGKEGGYLLARPPHRISMADIIRFLDGPFGPAEGATSSDAERDSSAGDSVFGPVWKRVQVATTEIYEAATFDVLLAEDQKRRAGAPSFDI